jgi:hypothetical protein
MYDTPSNGLTRWDLLLRIAEGWGRRVCPIRTDIAPWALNQAGAMTPGAIIPQLSELLCFSLAYRLQAGSLHVFFKLVEKVRGHRSAYCVTLS